MAVAARTGRLRRNFQGYTDDTAPVLIGLGASSISRFPQGYAQNASATAAYTKAVRAGQFSTARGHEFSGEDVLRARLIDAVMSDFRIDAEEMKRDFGATASQLQTMFDRTRAEFGEMVEVDTHGLTIPVHARALTRMIARTFDAYGLAKSGHSPAV